MWSMLGPQQAGLSPCRALIPPAHNHATTDLPPSLQTPHPSFAPGCRALAADPSDLDVLLSLGVSHTNELEQVGPEGVAQERRA